MGEHLSSKINKRRASDCAYHPGSITDDAETLSELRVGGPEMARLYTVLRPIVLEASKPQRGVRLRHKNSLFSGELTYKFKIKNRQECKISAHGTSRQFVMTSSSRAFMILAVLSTRQYLDSLKTHRQKEIYQLSNSPMKTARIAVRRAISLAVRAKV